MTHLLQIKCAEAFTLSKQSENQQKRIIIRVGGLSILTSYYSYDVSRFIA